MPNSRRYRDPYRQARQHHPRAHRPDPVAPTAVGLHARRRHGPIRPRLPRPQRARRRGHPGLPLHRQLGRIWAGDVLAGGLPRHLGARVLSLGRDRLGRRHRRLGLREPRGRLVPRHRHRQGRRARHLQGVAGCVPRVGPGALGVPVRHRAGVGQGGAAVASADVAGSRERVNWLSRLDLCGGRFLFISTYFLRENSR